MIAISKFEYIPPDLRSTVLRAYNFKCKKCGSTHKNLDLHHIVPRKKGGLNSINNLIPLCKQCHLTRHNMVTHLTYANDSSESIRTIVPVSVLRILGLTTSDTIRWIISGSSVSVKKQTDA